jgi:UDP-N-acetylmuramyl pentapeptide phosphotransferase/UDP-N-acetylglucosamine-1-phosphate transferase
LSILTGCVVAFAAAFFLTRRVRALAQSFGTMDVPNERSSHTVPTPRGGGVAFVLLTAAAGGWVALELESGLFAAYVLCALAVAGISLIDDFRSIPAGVRLLVHILAAIVFAVSVTSQEAMPFHLPVAAAGAVIVIWIVSLTNIFNFMDGIDGIAGCQATITFAAMGTAAALDGDIPLAAVCLVAASSILGFLMLNWPPARIFMGDVGSAFLGFSCGCLSVIRGNPELALVAVFATWPFIFDASLTLGRRALRRENILRSHRSHLYQRLAIAGYSHRRITTIYATVATATATAALLAVRDIVPLAVPLVVALAAASGLVILVVRAEAHRGGDAPAD